MSISWDYNGPIAIDDILTWTTTYDDASISSTYYSDGLDGKARTADDVGSPYGLSIYVFTSDAQVEYAPRMINFLYNEDATIRYDQFSSNFVKVSGDAAGHLYFQDVFDSASVNVFHTDDAGYGTPGTYGSIRYSTGPFQSQFDPDEWYVGNPYVLFQVTNISTTFAVPVPSTIILLGIGLLGIARLSQKNKY